MYDEGVSITGGILDAAEQYEITKTSGSWILYEGEKLGQGRENAKTFLKDNPKIANEIERAIRSNAGVADMLLAAPEGDEAKDADEGPDADGVLPDTDTPKAVAKGKR